MHLQNPKEAKGIIYIYVYIQNLPIAGTQAAVMLIMRKTMLFFG